MKRILLLLARGYETYDASAFIDVMGWNLTAGDRSTRLESCALERIVETCFKQTSIPDLLTSEIDCSKFDALVIPGGFEEAGFYQDAYSAVFSSIIQEFDRQNKPIAAVGVGALAIGGSGVLAGRRATTYNKNERRRNALRSFGVILVDQPVVVDRNVITCSNTATAIDVAFELLEILTSRDNANTVKALMGFDEKMGVLVS